MEQFYNFLAGMSVEFGKLDFSNEKVEAFMVDSFLEIALLWAPTSRPRDLQCWTLAAKFRELTESKDPE